MIPIPYGVRSYEDKFLPVSVQNLINLYLEPAPGGKQGILKPTPGLIVRSTLGGGPIRGQFKMNSFHYVVSGTTLYEETPSGTTSLGTIPGNNIVGMAANDRQAGKQIMVVNGTVTGYLYDAVNGFQEVTLTGPANTVAYQDGYFIFDWAGTGLWFVSSVNDGSTYDSTETGATNAREDNVLAILSSAEKIWVFGEDTIQIFRNSGGFDFPFSKIPDLTIDDLGLGAIRSVVKDDNAIYFVGNDRQVYQTNGYSPVMISDPAISHQLKNADLSKITCWMYKEDTNAFYQMNIESKSFRFNAKTKLWAEVAHHDGSYTRHRSDTYCNCFGKHLVGDRNSGTIYELGGNKDAGNYIRREMITPVIHAGGDQVAQSRVYADFRTTKRSTADPQVIMELSEDALTWSYHLPNDFGETGEYSHKVWWNSLGTYRDRAYKLYWTDDVETVLTGFYGA